MKIVVKLSGTSLVSYASRLDEMAAQLPSKVASALNEGGERTRTIVRKALWTQMNTKAYGPIVEATGSKSASAGSLAYQIFAQGRGLPITDFPTTYARSKAAQLRWDPRKHYLLQGRDEHGRFSAIPDQDYGAGVTSTPWAVVHAFARSFVRNGVPLAMRGAGSKRTRRLYGPNPGKELPKGESLASFEASVRGIVEPIISKRLLNLLP